MIWAFLVFLLSNTDDSEPADCQSEANQAWCTDSFVVGYEVTKPHKQDCKNRDQKIDQNLPVMFSIRKLIFLVSKHYGTDQLCNNALNVSSH